jgi:uncharacterized membrane protein YuzA (DUF378 family)
MTLIACGGCLAPAEFGALQYVVIGLAAVLVIYLMRKRPD